MAVRLLKTILRWLALTVIGLRGQTLLDWTTNRANPFACFILELTAMNGDDLLLIRVELLAEGLL